MIKEIIVVEGKKDAEAVARALDAECIITHGYTLPPSVMNQIRRAQKQRGVIILTDPDYAGEQIRRKINRLIPGCKHAFVAREDATANNDIGIEQAGPQAIRHALSYVHTEKGENRSEFVFADLAINGLVGTGGAAEKRNQLGKILGIGFANAKQFLHRLNVYGVSRDEFISSLENVADSQSDETWDKQQEVEL
jgi:ribonuclease M5